MGKGFGKSSGKGRGKSKGKGRGKGKGKRSAPSLDSSFWVDKVEEENRKQVGSNTFNGTIAFYKKSQGWGLISPDDLDSLPKNVKAKIEQDFKKVKAAGKEVSDKRIYFRKPDVNHEDGFHVKEGTACTFEVYVDEKGAGACNVSQ